MTRPALPRFYHRTTGARAATILADGFRDATGEYLTQQEHTGVWLSDVPLDANEGTSGDALLEVAIDGTEIAQYEWVQEPSFGYREWLVPAALLNSRAQVRLLTDEEEDALRASRRSPVPPS